MNPRLILPIVAVLGFGCASAPLPDPNESAEGGSASLKALRGRLRDASNSLNERKARGEIDETQYRSLITQLARDLVQNSKLDSVESGDLWMLGEVFVTAKLWERAEEALSRSVAHSAKLKGEQFVLRGRWVGDTLMLARAKAELGKYEEALKLARTTFDELDTAKAPILPAVLYEIVPAAEGKGRDLELGTLVEAAIEQHRRVIVDASAPTGKDFLGARPHHIARAYKKAADLYANAGRIDLARKAMRHSQSRDSLSL